jgi:Arc/MetJ-type ribon-helix-helix transcriptional regulator
MNVKLPPDQLKWIEGQVADGRFESVDEALAIAVADLMAMRADDLAWAKPYVDQAWASVARGDVMSGDEYLRRLDEKLAPLRS